MDSSENTHSTRSLPALRSWLSSQRNFKRLQQVLIFIVMMLGAIAMIHRGAEGESAHRSVRGSNRSGRRA